MLRAWTPGSAATAFVCLRCRRAPEDRRIVSRSGVPAEPGLSRDPRCPGVALRRIMVWQGPSLHLTDAADPLLGAGFHAFEPDHDLRWTNGDAPVPSALFAAISELELHVGCTTWCPLPTSAARRAA
jgi:hypothetical protein